MVRYANTKSSEEDGKKPAITYWAKEKVLCPVCQKEFAQEVMHKGGGRMVAGPLTDELHRLFEPSKRFGRVYPMIYEVGFRFHGKDPGASGYIGRNH